MVIKEAWPIVVYKTQENVIVIYVGNKKMTSEEFQEWMKSL